MCHSCDSNRIAKWWYTTYAGTSIPRGGGLATKYAVESGVLFVASVSSGMLC